MFTVEYRTRVREELIAQARADSRIESAAAVGGSARGEPEAWSDLDLGFGVARSASRDEVLEDWTLNLRRRFDAVPLFDLPVQTSIYRVFLLPGSLQVDLFFTPSADFGARGPKFALLFGTAVERKAPLPTFPREEFGLGVHHAVRARFCIDRGRFWQAEYWMSLSRDHALALACLRLGLESAHGRGFDSLPAEIREKAAQTLVRSLDAIELRRALRDVVELLLSESTGIHEDAPKIAAQLRELTD